MRGDVVTISHNANGNNNASAVSGNRHVLNGPGEYEIGSVFVTGIATIQESRSTRNVLFLFDYGNLTIAHLGEMTKVPTQTQIEALEQVDILLVPVGGGSNLHAGQAAELVSMLEPKIVIPMHYKIPGLTLDLQNVERFLQEMGVSGPEETNSLKVKASSLPQETQVVILAPKIKYG
jgi:L-ascorbate metabolism protein UlaG (beta-lactamase superfamily)